MTFGEHRFAIPSIAEYPVPSLWFMLREVDAILGRSVTVDQWAALVGQTT
jgi:hypothetical protein